MALTVVAGGEFARAQDTESPPTVAPISRDALADEVRALRESVQRLEGREQRPTWETIVGRLDKLEAGAKPKDDPNKWTVKLGGHVQMDYVNWAHADPAITGPAAAPGAEDYFEFRRLRLTADGKGYGNLDFRLQMTLEPETVGDSAAGTVTSPEVKDAYLSINEIPWLGRFRIGNFFVPFGLEQVTNDTFNVFLERSIPTQGIFTADREVGIAFYNCTEDKNLTWTYGLFFDSISEGLKERIDDNQGYRLSGRVTWLPYYDEESNGRYLIHTGLGVLHTADQNDSVRFRARPQIHEGPRLIDSGAIAADSYSTGNVELAVVWGPVTVQSEAYLSNVKRLAGGAVNVWGAYAHCSYFLTGENRIYERFGQHGAQFGRNVPITNFSLTRGGCGWGAWEAKARWSYLDLDELSAGRYHDLTMGLNWYWSDRTRVMFDWIHPFTSDQTTFGSTQSDLLAMRFDFNW
jgi:phosphate-selective porin OprO/OprP